MKVLVAAEDSGCVKQVVCPPKTDTSVQTAPQVEELSTFAENGRENIVDEMIIVNDLIVLARRKGLQVYNMEWELQIEYKQDDKDKCISISKYDDENVIVCRESAKVLKYSLTNEDIINEIDLKVKNIKTFTQSPFDKDIYAYGGEGLDLRVSKLDFENAKVEKDIYKGKNVKNDRLDMPVPVFIEGVVFITESQLVTCTHLGQLRYYDFKLGRRPQNDKKVSNKPIQSLILKDENTVICSDNHSSTAEYSIKEWRSTGKFHGATGAVQAMQKGTKYFATGGLDRYLRVFDVNTREIVAKVFVGQQIKSVWIVDESDKRKSSNEAEEEEDKLWDEIEKPKKKSKKV